MLYDAWVAELAYARHSKRRGSNPLRVRVPPQALTMKESEAYLMGLALGDGNLSNPNKRAVRLRISCDPKYPLLINEIKRVFSVVFPKNKIGIFRQKSCFEVSVYSNRLPTLLGWRWDQGPKNKQGVCIPQWIKAEPIFMRICLRGLFQTDGSLYNDRGYTMLNFTNTCAPLINNVLEYLVLLGYRPNLQTLAPRGNARRKFTVRISRRTEELIDEIGYWKA